jgi:hypothetical protein
MSTAQRVSRGFHWLGLFLATLPLLIGVSSLPTLAEKKHMRLVARNDSRESVPA